MHSTILYNPFGWGWLAGLAGQPPHMGTIHMNQSTVLLSHINEPATIRTSQPNIVAASGSRKKTKESNKDQVNAAQRTLTPTTTVKL